MRYITEVSVHFVILQIVDFKNCDFFEQTWAKVKQAQELKK